MPAASWLRTWKSRATRRTTTIERPKARRSAVRARLELLEDRVQPSTVTWINPAGGDWDNPANWQDQSTGQNRVPGASDDAVIDLGANNFTVTHSAGTDAVNSLTDQAAFTMSGGSLGFGSSSVVSGPFAFTGGTLTGVNGTAAVAAAASARGTN